MKLTHTKTAKESNPIEVIHLGIDTHVNKFVVVAQEDGLNPKPAVTFKEYNTLLKWVKKQQKRCVKVVACYEAGPTGYYLCRELEKIDVTCHVVAPKKWAENDNGVKTDKKDAKILCMRLERYESGQHSVFSIVRVPSIKEEQKRLKVRHRDNLKKEIKRNSQRARGIGCTYNISMKGTWWKGFRWEELKQEAPEEMLEIFQSTKNVIDELEKEERALIKEIEAEEDKSGRPRPKWAGALSMAVISAEVCDFYRFNNRREVGSFTGCCPSESSSGQQRFQGSINKHGNGRIRHYLIEMVWRLIRNQPEWHAWKKYKDSFKLANKSRQKQLVTAMARMLAIDLWRLSTGQTTLEKLGFEPA